VTKPDAKTRRGTLADLRGILSGMVKKPLTDEELRQWIDEARSRALPDNLRNRITDKIPDRHE
jgi:hypothetical protein